MLQAHAMVFIIILYNTIYYELHDNIIIRIYQRELIEITIMHYAYITVFIYLTNLSQNKQNTDVLWTSIYHGFPFPKYHGKSGVYCIM